MSKFVLKAPYKPNGDQPKAIEALSKGITDGLKDQVLLGVTGSGKTFTMAAVIEKIQKPTLVLAHNKTLAAQLCSEFREFFPDSAVEYFVSYYDYYQPEAYIASSDTYIEKETSINEEIDRLRHSATSAIRERKDVIIVSSVSCIYSMGDPSEYDGLMVSLRPGMHISREKLIDRLIDIQFLRNDINFERGTFRVRGDVVEIIPASQREHAIRIEFFGDEIDRIREIEIISGHVISTLEHAIIFPATHYVMDKEHINENINRIEKDLEVQLEKFRSEDKLIEAQRLEERTHYDIEMMKQVGYCNGIENYSRYFDGRKPGDAPFTLIDYFPKDFLLIIDESHITVPQVGAMYKGDRARKNMLVEYGFRLPSAYDNRPLVFDEFRDKIHQTIYVSATPGKYEMSKTQNVVEQIIRPTGLIDPEIKIRPATGQVDDLVGEIDKVVKSGNRILVTTLTKRMAEDLTEYLFNLDIKVRYLHSDIKTLERSKIIRELREGEFDVLVGINLLREGIDMPEVAMVAILDADKEGFLRNETSLIQIIGRAARNLEGYVVLYADRLTDSIIKAVNETNRRREIQKAYNEENHITPQGIKSTIHKVLQIKNELLSDENSNLNAEEIETLIESIEDQMLSAAKNLDFETAATLRDRLFAMRNETAPKVNKPQIKRAKYRKRK